MSKQNILVLEAFNKGYKIKTNGDAIGLKGNKLSLSKTSKGYLSFNIRFEGKITRLFVHRLQAYQKYGSKIFEKGIVVRHKNNISEDNSWNNILIGTQSDNMMDVPKNKRRKMASSPKYDHKNIILDFNKGVARKDLIIKYSIKSKGTLSWILNKSMAQEK